MSSVKTLAALMTGFLLALAARADTKPAVTTKVPSDQDFLAKAIEGGVKEVQFGKKALDKAASADVKKFAQHMVDDHSKTNQELVDIATEKKVGVVAGLSKADRATLLRLTKAKGDDFDRQYMRNMVEDHEQDVALFDSFAKNGKDERLRNFAAKTLPTLKAHLRMAREVEGKLKK